MVLQRIVWFIIFTGITQIPALAEVIVKKNKQVCNLSTLSRSVDQANTKLLTMKDQYRTSFKKQLRILKIKKGWSDREFIKNAQPLIQNNQTTAFDKVNKQLISSITALKSTNGEATPNCEMLAQLNFRLDKIIKNTRNKWDHMLLKIKAETEKSF